MENPPVLRVEVRLVADPRTASYLRLFYAFTAVGLVPPMRRGVPRRIRSETYSMSWNSSLILCVPWDPEELSLRQYSLNLKGIIYYLDRQNIRITLIWPLTSNLSLAEQSYFTQHTRKFRRWIRAKRLLIDVISPAQPIPPVMATDYVGNPAEIFGQRFFAELNHNIPNLQQGFPEQLRICPPFTVPREQTLAEFVTNSPA